MVKYAALLPCLALALSSPVAAAERPNVVFFLVDDLGYMDIGANNPESFYETPNVDRLAASGMRFTDGYAANPVCSPTRYSIMTGRYPTRAGATNWFSGVREGRFRPAPLNDRMALEEVTLAEALREAGYRTFFAGKWHLGPTEEYWPEAQGFEVNRGGWSRGGPYGPGQYFTPYGNPRLEDGPEGEHLPDRLASETVRFIEEHRDEPFLAYLSFYSVHTPLVGRPDLVAKYEDKIRKPGARGEGGVRRGGAGLAGGRAPQRAGPPEARGLRRDGRGHGPGRGPGPRPARRPRARRENRRLLHVGQRRSVDRGGLAHEQPPAARRQGLALRGRDPRAVPDPGPRGDPRRAA